MLLAPVLGSLLLLAGPDYHDTPEWKAYQKQVVGAFAIEVRWTEREFKQGRLSDKTRPDVVRSFHARCMKPAYLWLEETGVRRVVWDGKAGLDFDLKARSYERLSKLPKLAELHWLDLPECPDPQRSTGQYNAVENSTEQIGQDGLQSVKATIHEIDFARIWTFYFDPKTHLIRLWNFKSYGMGPHTELLRAVTAFDLTPLLIRTDFDLTVPQGFAEKTKGTPAEQG